MSENITLTIEEIHKIREEHYEKTKAMPFDEYQKNLKAEIAPFLVMLNNAKAKRQAAK